MPKNSIREIIACLRIEGYSSFLKQNLMDKLVNNLSNLATALPMEYIIEYNKIMQDILTAIQSNDAILLADLLEYKLLPILSSY